MCVMKAAGVTAPGSHFEWLFPNPCMSQDQWGGATPVSGGPDNVSITLLKFYVCVSVCTYAYVYYL